MIATSVSAAHAPMPNRQLPPPNSASGTGQPGRRGGADRQRGRVDGCHRRDLVGVVPLDQGWHQHVRDGAAGQGKHAQQAETASCRQPPRAGPTGGAGQQGRGQQPVLAEPVRQPRAEIADAGERDHRQGGDDPGRAAGQAQAGFDVVEDRPDTAHRHPHGQAGQHDRGDDQPTIRA